MAKPKKLKVFRTPIGFHDAYVAAPSQKAALEAWGTDTNLFASGTAEQVTDPELMKAPLERPGEVVKVLRGSAVELRQAKGKGNRPSRKPSPARGRGRKPSAAETDKADRALAALEKRQQAEIADIAREEKALAQRRRSTERRHEAEHDAAAEERDRVRAQYERALRNWEKGDQA